MEKFALLNLLNALSNLTPKTSAESAPQQNGAPAPETEKPPQPEQAENTYPNVMASVLERHEIIANRIRNKK